MSYKKPALALLIAAIISIYFAGGGEKYLSIELYQGLYEQSPVATAVTFFLVFLLSTACSLPVTAALAVASGVLFGPLFGFLISAFSTTLGGTLSLYSSRFLFHDVVQRRFAKQLAMVNKGIEKEGAFYLFGLRMVPVVPFWLLNLVMGLTSMRVPVFMLATFLGMLPVLFIFAYTGSELGEIESFSVAAIFTPGLILSLVLLASFPLMAKVMVGWSRRRMAGKPQR